jgi:hypothetical protein
VRRSSLLRPITILAAGLALGCADPQSLTAPAAGGGQAFARAEPTTSVEVFIDEFTATLFCTNEEVAWTGRVVLVRHTTFNQGVPPAPDSFQHLIEVDNVHFTGIGLSSGDTYRYHARLNHSFQSPDPEDPFPTTENLAFRERIIGPGGVIGFFTFTLRFVVSGTGEVVIEPVEVVEEECR